MAKEPVKPERLRLALAISEFVLATSISALGSATGHNPILIVLFFAACSGLDWRRWHRERDRYRASQKAEVDSRE